MSSRHAGCLVLENLCVVSFLAPSLLFVLFLESTCLRNWNTQRRNLSSKFHQWLGWSHLSGQEVSYFRRVATSHAFIFLCKWRNTSCVNGATPCCFLLPFWLRSAVHIYIGVFKTGASKRHVSHQGKQALPNKYIILHPFQIISSLTFSTQVWPLHLFKKLYEISHFFVIACFLNKSS